jgi:hypothetical protein
VASVSTLSSSAPVELFEIPGPCMMKHILISVESSLLPSASVYEPFANLVVLQLCSEIRRGVF